jgi:hypothetical protein
MVCTLAGCANLFFQAAYHQSSNPLELAVTWLFGTFVAWIVATVATSFGTREGWEEVQQSRRLG